MTTDEMIEAHEAFQRIYRFAQHEHGGSSLVLDANVMLTTLDRVEALEKEADRLGAAYQSAVEYNDALKESHYENVKHTAEELMDLRTRVAEAKRIFKDMVEGLPLAFGHRPAVNAWLGEDDD